MKRQPVRQPPWSFPKQLFFEITTKQKRQPKAPYPDKFTLRVPPKHSFSLTEAFVGIGVLR